MGTNYYLAGETCPHCGQELANKPKRHIGKSSAGWVFGLHIVPEEGINDLWDWVKLWDKPGAKIVDEYGGDVTPYEMLKKIILKRHEPTRHDVPFDHAANHSEPTYNGLVRARKGQYCNGHGYATWSKYEGEFS